MTIDYIALMPKGYIQDPNRGAVYPAQPDQIDDLTQIHGIGEVLESQLNLNGVYRLEQIATWDQTNIEAFSNMMPCFQDRIERNYWILQAQRIIERRQGSRPMAAHGSASSGFPAGLIQTVMMVAIALLIGLLFVQWLAGGQPRTYAGNLRARTFHAVANTSGTVSDFLVDEGEQVLEGQKIVTLRDGALDVRREQQATKVALLQKAVEAARAKAEVDVQWRIHQIDKEITEHRQTIAMAQEAPPAPIMTPVVPPVIETAVPTRTASHKRKYRSPIFFSAAGSNTIRPLMRATQTKELEPTSPSEKNDDPFAQFAPTESGLQTATRLPVLLQVSGAQTEAKPVALSSVERIRLAEERISTLESIKTSLRDSLERANGLPTAKAELATAIADLESLKDSQHEVTVTTSGFGIVSKRLCQAGDEVEVGQPILELVDSRNQHIAALIPSRHVDSIEPGMKVSLYFPGNHHRRGRINSLPVRTTERGESGESVLEIRIEPMGGLWPAVPIGSQVQVALD